MKRILTSRAVYREYVNVWVMCKERGERREEENPDQARKRIRWKLTPCRGAFQNRIGSFIYKPTWKWK